MYTFNLDNFFRDYSQKKYTLTSTGILDNTNSMFFNLEHLYALLNVDYQTLLYRIFYTSYGKNILFIANPTFNVYKSINSTTRSGIFIKGALYDLDNQEFIFPNIKNCRTQQKWLIFYIYDDSIPHIYRYGTSVICYKIIFWNKKHRKYSTLIAKNIHTLISYSYNKNDANSALKKQIIFATTYGKKHNSISINKIHGYEEIDANNIMIILTPELRLICIENRLHFESACLYNPSNNNKLELLHFSDDDKVNLNKLSDLSNKTLHLKDNDAIIFKSYRGEFGEFVLLFLNCETKIDYTLSFFHYDISDDIISCDSKHSNHQSFANHCIVVTSRRNDFENFSHIISLESQRIYNDI